MKLTGVRPSVCPSVPFHHSPTARRSGWFAAVGPVSSKDRAIAAAAAGECGQCHVVGVRIGR